MLAGMRRVRIVFRQHQAHGDPEQEDGTNELQEGQAQQHADEGGEYHPQDDRRADAQQNTPFAQPLGQRAAGQRNDHGVVAA